MIEIIVPVIIIVIIIIFFYIYKKNKKPKLENKKKISKVNNYEPIVNYDFDYYADYNQYYNQYYEDDIISNDKFNFLLNELKKKDIMEIYIESYKHIYMYEITNKYFNKIIKHINIKPFTIIDSFLSNDECDKLLELSKDRFFKSKVDQINPQLDNNIRSSETCIFEMNENTLIENIENKIINLLNINIEKLEHLLINKYNKNDFYTLHHDYNIKTNNLRKYSIIIYLNDLEPEDGGETHFPLYNTKITPKKGTILYFDNLFLSDRLENNLTVHEGLPLLTDKTKFILTTWSHVNDFS